MAGGRVRHLGHGVGQLVEAGQRGPRPGDEDRAGRCELHSATRPFEQPGTELAFQELDAPAEGDNRSTRHYAAWDYFPQTRSGRRVSVVGERSF